jgi:hypothetical protein
LAIYDARSNVRFAKKRSARDRRWWEPANRKPIVIELSRYVFETLREDEEFAFCRGQKDDGNLPSILLLTPVSERPAPAISERLEHKYSLRDELDSGWAARPLNLVRREGQPMLMLEDPAGEPLDRLLGRPMELSRFLRFAVALAAALGKLHQQGLIHKDSDKALRSTPRGNARED